jgi:hypothetical protein
MATGKTVGKFTKFQLETSSGGLADIPVTSYGSVGLTAAEVDVTSLQDSITNVLNGQNSWSTTITGPFDNRARVAGSTTGNRPALSGSHTILSPLMTSTYSATPRSFGIYIGIQGDWATNDPVFGGIDCILVSGYTVDPAAGTYSCKLSVAGNRSAISVNGPAWGTAQIAASS